MLTYFLQPLWLWNPSWSHSCIGQWYKLSVSSFSKWRRFGFADAPSISDQLTLHFLLILSFLEHLANRNRWQTEELHIYVSICQGMPLLARPHYYCAKFKTVRCNQTCPSRAARALLFASLKRNDTLTWDHIAKRKKMVRNVFPNHQFRNNMFHSEIGIRNKTVLIYQFGNNVFHLQIGTRNKTVLIYQFGNTMFHLQTGTRNEMFPSYTWVDVLFLPCKKAGPLIVNTNTKTRNSRYLGNVPLWNIGIANET